MGEELVLYRPDLYAEKKVFSRIGFSLFLLAALSLVLQIAIFSVIGLAYPAMIIQTWFVILISLLSMYLIAAPCTLSILRGIPSTPIEKRGIGAGRFFKVFCVCISIMIAGGLIGSVLSEAFGIILNTQPENAVAELVIETPFLPNLILLVAIVPIAEEYIFRKVLIEKIIKYGEGVAVLLSALFFALVHGNFYQFFYAFGLGAVFAYVYIKTGRLRYPVILHMIINFIGSVITPELTNMAGSGELAGIIIFGLYNYALLGAAISGIVFFFLDKNKISLEKGVCALPKGKRFSTIWLNAGIMVYTISCIAFFVISIIG